MITEIEYKRVNLLRSTFERKYSMLFAKLLNAQFKAVASKINETNYTEPPLSVISEDDVRKLFVSLYRTVGSHFAIQSYRYIKSRGDEELIDRWSEEMARYAREQAGSRITSITSLTKDQIRNIIGDAVQRATDEGLGAAETAKYIKHTLIDQGEFINTYRSLRIARTEVMVASNAGSLTGAKELGVPMDKIWIATLDSRTRDTHAAMNNTAVDINADFELPDGARMEAPGDARGGPENVINCRCTISYRVKRGDTGAGSEPGKPIEIETPQISIARSIVEQPEFKPAATIKEAEATAKAFADVVDYKGLNIDGVNQINKRYLEFQKEYNLDKLKFIGKQSTLEKLYPMRHQRIAMGYAGKYNSIALTPKSTIPNSYTEGIKYYADTHSMSSTRDMLKNFMKAPQEVQDLAATITERKQVVSRNPADMFTHEVGHKIQQNLPKDLKDELLNILIEEKQKGYSYLLSDYAWSNQAEFFAESFTAYNIPSLRKYVSPRIIDFIVKNIKK